ncbi:MmpS family transport accessory protein [Catenuloplanes sp. NPDC051500]|uniref:MmpS family transport accessory protein n=1 Tax=Catenuloplanes sp. NPDC051500 TaxID=3363959 RepID=UPI0037AAF9EE
MTRIRLPLIATALLLALATTACSSNDNEGGAAGGGTTAVETAAPAPTSAATAGGGAGGSAAGIADGSSDGSAGESADGSAGESADGNSGILTDPVANGVTLRVTGAGATTAQVSYEIDGASTEDKHASVPWQKTATPAGEVAHVSLIVMSPDTDDLTCEIFVNGTSVRTAQAAAKTGGVASCDWTNANA